MNNLPKRIQSTRFGELEIDEARVIEFADGLPGFEDCRHFLLLHSADGAMTYFILQSVEQADIAFHIADPTQFGFSYEISLSAEEEQNLQLDKPEDAAVMVMLYREGGVADAPIRANLNAPLVLNPKARRCIQHRFAKLSYDLANATESTP